MSKIATEDTVTIPKEEYNLLREVYKTVKRQNFLLRIAEAEKNLRLGKVKKIMVEDFIANI
jgi:hypothetical protein